MSRHEGVSCDSCLKNNFRGRRYKCLVCYDYDLCSTCYEAKATTTRHEATHPMQCILTRADFDLYYGGDTVNADYPQSFTCPYCGKMGYTEVTLHDHVNSDHSDSSAEIICPICASLSGGDPNHVTDDFCTHLHMEHRGQVRDLYDDPVVGSSGSGSRLSRRAPLGRGLGGRNRRHTPGGSSHSSAGGRDMDPIAELLSHLSGVRRSVVSGTPQQLRDLQMQLEAEREHARVLSGRDRTLVFEKLTVFQEYVAAMSQQLGMPAEDKFDYFSIIVRLPSAVECLFILADMYSLRVPASNEPPSSAIGCFINNMPDMAPFLFKGRSQTIVDFISTMPLIFVISWWFAYTNYTAIELRPPPDIRDAIQECLEEANLPSNLFENYISRFRDHIQRQRIPRVEPRSFQQSADQSASAATSTSSLCEPGKPLSGASGSSSQHHANRSQYLLANYSEAGRSEAEEQAADIVRAERSLFVQELFLSTLSESLRISGSHDGELPIDNEESQETEAETKTGEGVVQSEKSSDG